MSKPARGILEGLLRTKKYSIPLTIAQPWVPVGLAAGYLTTGRFNAPRHADRTLGPMEMEHQALMAATGGPPANLDRSP